MFPIPLLQLFRCFYNCFLKRANAISTGRFIRKTFVEHRREFIENCPYGKQIDDFVDMENMQKSRHAPKHIFWVWNLKNLETWFQLLKSLRNIIKMLTKILWRMAVTLFQTSS